MPRCKAKAKSSQKHCRRPTMRGGFVCAQHGGMAPQVKAKAQERDQVAGLIADRSRHPVQMLHCHYCEKWWSAGDDSLAVHVLVAHPKSDDAEVILAWKDPPRVPRDW